MSSTTTPDRRYAARWAENRLTDDDRRRITDAADLRAADLERTADRATSYASDPPAERAYRRERYLTNPDALQITRRVCCHAIGCTRNDLRTVELAELHELVAASVAARVTFKPHTARTLCPVTMQLHDPLAATCPRCRASVARHAVWFLALDTNDAARYAAGAWNSNNSTHRAALEADLI
jgi:hypothetical protein